MHVARQKFCEFVFIFVCVVKGWEWGGDLCPNHPQKLTQRWNPCSANGEHPVVPAPAFFQTHNCPPPPLCTHARTSYTHSLIPLVFFYWSWNKMALIFPTSLPFDLLVVSDFSRSYHLCTWEHGWLKLNPAWMVFTKQQAAAGPLFLSLYSYFYPCFIFSSYQWNLRTPSFKDLTIYSNVAWSCWDPQNLKKSSHSDIFSSLPVRGSDGTAGLGPAPPHLAQHLPHDHGHQDGAGDGGGAGDDGSPRVGAAAAAKPLSRQPAWHCLHLRGQGGV